MDVKMMEERMSRVTPGMRQYIEMKIKAGDALLFFRLGDFYEMFFEDAEIVSRELELVLTGKDCGLDERAPMCGIPHHAYLNYIARLVSKGYKVAVCEQLEDPALAKGIVKRDIIKIYTPGTVTDERMLEQKVNNYIACIFGLNNLYGFAVADITTGEFKYTSITIGATFVHLKDELAKFSPREIIVNQSCKMKDEIVKVSDAISGAFVNVLPDGYFDLEDAKTRFAPLTPNGKADVDELPLRAIGALLYYLADTQKNDLTGILVPECYRANEFMAIDSQSRRNLELTETMRDRKKTGTLLWVLDKTSTAMGGRMLRRWVEEPLIDKIAIDTRLDAVADLFDKFMLRNELCEALIGVYDMERLANKIVMGSVNAKELLSLKSSLGRLPAIKELLSHADAKALREIGEEINPLDSLYDLLERGINEEPPMVITEGGIIKTGYNEEIDRYREASVNGKKWLSDLEAKEREETGIKKLKIAFNRVFGYSIDVPNSSLGQVPERYIRKQTLAAGERFVTEELKEIEQAILGAEASLVSREYELFVEIRDICNTYGNVLKTNAARLAEVDALCSLATVAERENYSRPEITEDRVINIKNGRHPVIEKMPGCDQFVPNDGYLDGGENMISVITGPNMAGKSTYMRQTALIVLMAQIGSFVPADSACIGIADKIFTRVGASDDLAQGQSTFMVEMCEVANIVANATENSLLILDEIGRGTSTFDGLSIAWAVLEYIATNIKARTLFATHYHELTELEGKLPSVKNYCVDVKKKGDEITFLRKIKRGGADGSYGIAVATLAGVPKAITIRANEILATLEEQDLGRREMKITKKRSQNVDSDLDLFAFATATAMQDDIIEELKKMDVQKMTPIECMNALYELQQRANDRV